MYNCERWCWFCWMDISKNSICLCQRNLSHWNFKHLHLANYKTINKFLHCSCHRITGINLILFRNSSIYLFKWQRFFFFSKESQKSTMIMSRSVLSNWNWKLLYKKLSHLNNVDLKCLHVIINIKRLLWNLHGFNSFQ